VFSHMAFLWNFNFFHFRIPYTHLLKSFFASSLSGSIFRTIGNQIAGFLQESGFGLYFAQFEDSRPPAQVAKPDHGFNHSVRIFFFPDKYEICRPVGVDHVFKLKRQEGGGYGAAEHNHQSGYICKGVYIAANDNGTDNQAYTGKDPGK